MVKKFYCPACGDYDTWVNGIAYLLDPHLKTVRVTSALEKIINNLDRIPIEELEKLGDKYGL